ncbi:MAG: LysE family translocator [Opitutae bacterium]|nr:LysE family translocator [Opitutae bacterium]
MLNANEWTLFVLMCGTMSLTPGPNMLYLTSRALCQGRPAAVVSLWGVMAGFVVHATLAVSGVSALLRTVPLAFGVLRCAGAGYLLWLAWRIARPGAATAFQPRALPAETSRRLFVAGFTVNVLNPQAVLLYLSIFSQFVRPERGAVLGQSVLLSGVQMAISFAVNLVYIFAAGGMAAWFAQRPGAVRAQRLVLGGVLGVLALRLMLLERI